MQNFGVNKNERIVYMRLEFDTKDKEDSTSYKICKLLSDSFLTTAYDIPSLSSETKTCSPASVREMLQFTRCAHAGILTCLELIVRCGALFIVSQHMRRSGEMCMLLVKMEQITFRHWGRESEYRSWFLVFRPHNLPWRGIDWALGSDKEMVNNTLSPTRGYD
jgi:hypothetical protein